MEFSFDITGLEGNQPWFYYWIAEREKARLGREYNWPKPWTLDSIIQQYRFCNVRREDDKVTKWIKHNWRDPYDGNVNMVTAMVVARLFNRIETLELVKFPEFDRVQFPYWLENTRKKLKDYRTEGNTVFTGAYLVSTNGHSMDKIDYLLDRVVTPIAKSPMFGDAHSAHWKSLSLFHSCLVAYDGMGSFMAGQVVADLKYTTVLRNAEDWWTWAPIGPGSRRGLNRYFGRKLEASIKTEQVLAELNMLKLQVQQRLGIELPVHDIQNVCCETDKYLRTKLGEGKPRSRYAGL